MFKSEYLNGLSKPKMGWLYIINYNKRYGFIPKSSLMRTNIYFKNKDEGWREEGGVRAPTNIDYELKWQNIPKENKINFLLPRRSIQNIPIKQARKYKDPIPADIQIADAADPIPEKLIEQLQIHNGRIIPGTCHIPLYFLH